MSEYQYYEFLAIDRPLDRSEMAELRALSTRAEITPTRFANEYNWGSFKGSPEKMMEKYFDAHVYVANWGHYRFMLRLPIDCVDEETVQAYVADGCLGFWTTEDHLIVEWSHEDEPESYDVEGEGWLARLVPIREELERGDYRALYLGWLFGVGMGVVPEDAVEPPPPAGLGSLTPAQQALVEFLGIDTDLLTGAAVADSPAPIRVDYAAWVAGVPIEETREYLVLMLEGRSKQAEQQLRSRYLKSTASLKPSAPSPLLRSVANLLELAEQAEAERLKREEEDRQRKLAESRRQREQYLAFIANSFERHWKLAYELAGKKTASAYDSASSLIEDLADAYALKQQHAEFQARLADFRATHARAAALMRRLDKVRLMAEK